MGAPGEGGEEPVQAMGHVDCMPGVVVGHIPVSCLHITHKSIYSAGRDAQLMAPPVPSEQSHTERGEPFATCQASQVEREGQVFGWWLGVRMESKLGW